MDIDIEALKRRFEGVALGEHEFPIVAEELAAYAQACGETLPRYTDPADPDFQAVPTFASSLTRGRNIPEDFPLFGGLPMDGGKVVRPLKPIRPGITLTGRSHVHEVYLKTGRSGSMIFVLSRMELFEPSGEQVAVADTRIVIRERPAP